MHKIRWFLNVKILTTKIIQLNSTKQLTM